MSLISVLIPAYNEAGSIADTIEALLAQDRIPDRIVVIPNGCTDATATIARRIGKKSRRVVVYALPKLEHKKSQALNMAWQKYAKDSDVVVCLDADTHLPPNAIRDWEREFDSDKPTHKKSELTNPLGGSSSKFTMLGKDLLTRLQRAEFAKWTDTALRKKRTSVLAGTGCAISGKALREVAQLEGREGPWAYTSQVEDFELTYQIRLLGYRCQVSPTVRAYTDSMKSVRSLWGQRMKWQVGTVEDLLSLGVNKLTRYDWGQQMSGLFMAFIRLMWLVLTATLILTDQFRFSIAWLVVVPLCFVFIEVHAAFRIPHRDKTDILLAFLIVPAEMFAWLRAGWFTKAWVEVLLGRITGKRKDRWQLQYVAEGTE